MNRFGDRTPAVDVLRRTELFGSLADDDLTRLAGAARTRTFRRGQYLWYQGDPGDTLLVVCDGRLKIFLGSETGDEAVLHSVGSCEVLGELAVLDGAPRSASVVALENTTALVLSRATVFDAMARHPAVLEAMLRALGQLVRRLTELNGDLVFLDLGGRLAKLLLRLAEGQTPAEDGVVLDTRAHPVRARDDDRRVAARGEPGAAPVRRPKADPGGRPGDRAAGPAGAAATGRILTTIGAVRDRVPRVTSAAADTTCTRSRRRTGVSGR